MSGPFRLLFDENFGKPIVSALAQLLNFHPEPPEIGCVVDRFGSGTKDREWIPIAAKEGWVILSNDRAKRCGGDKLHLVCAEHGATHILISTALHQMKQFYKAAAVLQVWDSITTVRDAPPGSRFLLRLHFGKPTVFPWESKPKNVSNITPPNEKPTRPETGSEDSGKIAD